MTLTYNELKNHCGHKLEVQEHGPDNDKNQVTIECVTCGIILVEFFIEPDYSMQLPFNFWNTTTSSTNELDNIGVNVVYTYNTKGKSDGS